jgi:hypothetical protein
MKLVARFWNEDGVEMPGLYRAGPDDGNHVEGSLVCNWNYLYLVSPRAAAIESAAYELRQALLRGSPGWLDTPAGRDLTEALGRSRP